VSVDVAELLSSPSHGEGVVSPWCLGRAAAVSTSHRSGSTAASPRRSLAAVAALAVVWSCGGGGAPGAGLADADDGGPVVLHNPDAGGEDIAPDAALSCVPHKRFCLSPTISATCLSTGLGYTAPQDCAEGTFCRGETGECQLPFCQPLAVQCEDTGHYRQCYEDGFGWTEGLACPEQTTCTGDRCVYDKCLANVLLVVDRSGSMWPRWQAVLSSLSRLVQGNPDARFALLGFPYDKEGGTGCDVPTELDVPLDVNAPLVFTAWFADHPPNGNTPLLYAMQAAAQLAPAAFGDAGGTVVVLSDGEDTCVGSGAVGPLGEVTQQLWDQHGIATYVIGYNYDGDPSQLNDIAAHGGTTHATYIPAGSEAELDDAFEGIVHDFKLCH